MSSPRLVVQTIKRINGTGPNGCIEIRPDGDGNGLIEIVSIYGGQIVERLTVTSLQAKILCETLKDYGNGLSYVS